MPRKKADDAERSVDVPPRRTRISALWTGVAIAVILGVALVIFIVQNTRAVQVHFLGANGRVPVAVALLAAALVGAAIVLIAGVSRTTQIRLAARRRWKRKSSNDTGPTDTDA
jgi:uncharacterized integral membrane protein